MPKKRAKSGGEVVAFPKRPKERWRTGGFIPLPNGTPTFELDGEQCSEFGIEDPDLMSVLCQKLLERKCWFMALPPERQFPSWMFVQYADAEFVMSFLNQFEGAYINRGLHNPAD